MGVSKRKEERNTAAPSWWAALINTENIKTDGAEVDSQIEEMKKYYTEQSATNPEAKKALEHLGSPEYRSYVKNILNSRKTIDKLKEWNIVE